MKTIGLTGPSGAGKGYCYRFFEILGIACIDTDDVYHKLLIPPSDCVDELVSEFGNTIIGENGSVNRKELANIVFSDETRQKLGSFHIFANRSAHAVEAVGSNRHTNTGTADQDTGICFTLGNFAGYDRSKIRIIIGLFQ